MEKSKPSPRQQTVSAAAPAQRAAEQPTGADDHKRSRACDNCRALKVRCVPHDEKYISGSCHRCFKSSRSCVFTVNPRKRQKRTDTYVTSSLPLSLLIKPSSNSNFVIPHSRVADLEKKLDELTQRLSAAREEGDSVDSTSPEPADVNHRAAASSTQVSEVPSRMSPHISNSLPHPFTPPPASCPVLKTTFDRTSPSQQQLPSLHDHSKFTNPAELATKGSHEASSYDKSFRSFFGRPDSEAIRLRSIQPAQIEGILAGHGMTDEMAQDMLDYFVTKAALFNSIVYIKEDTKFNDLLHASPVLSLAICSIMSNQSDQKIEEMSANLMVELHKIVSEQVLIVGNKSADLVQTLLTLSFWHSPLESFECQKVHIFTACAVAMANDLGIGHPPRLRAKTFDYDTDGRRVPSTAVLPSPENCRIWLAVFLSSSILSMLYQQTALLQWSSYLEDCCKVLEESQKAKTDFDSRLCSLARLHAIVDDINSVFHPRDYAELVDIRESRTSHLIRMFEKRLAAWKKNCPNDRKNKILSLAFELVLNRLHSFSLDLLPQLAGLYARSGPP